jgi:O-methyltransferase involved in polyketide biosynthesis
MSIALPVFTPMQETLYLTLCGRALDDHLPHPILGDTMAEEIVRKLGHDCGRFHLSASPIINIAHRAKKLDEVAQQFIARHPHAVGLDLGAGLDTRVFRIAPPSTVVGQQVRGVDVLEVAGVGVGEVGQGGWDRG